MNYYGYKLEEVLDMEVSDYHTLLKLMSINQARDHLLHFEANAYPKLKESKRDEVFKKHYKIAYPKDFEVKNVVKLSDLQRVLK
jgi:hypothetical protein